MATVVSPLVLMSSIGISSLIGVHWNERALSRLTLASVGVALFAALLILTLMLWRGERFVSVEVGDWVAIPEQHFHFRFKFIFDRLSLPFLILSLVLCGVIAAFNGRYLHREPGYQRFFFSYALFLTGIVACAAAGTIETLFFGWELVGLSSALLIAYFHERNRPVQNGQRVWSVYRLSDAAFLIAALAMHHWTGEGDFGSFVGVGPWPEGQTAIDSQHALMIGLLLLIAAAGKSGLVPFSGWLPRAMEGPTSSSAVFYGALSIHLGAYLLLRVSPILEASIWLTVAVVLVGAVSAFGASLMSRVQSDIKASLAYASLTQVGIIVVEIGIGFRYLALVHIIGHACLRTLQLLRAATLLHDYHTLENAIGRPLTSRSSVWSRWSNARLRLWWYRFALESGYMDRVLDQWVVGPFVALFQWADQTERRWTDWLSGEASSTNAILKRHGMDGVGTRQDVSRGNDAIVISAEDFPEYRACKSSVAPTRSDVHETGEDA
ncbi:MAG: proton-conducting transporter membrane subunit [Planctomycetota bacterium]